MSKRVIYRLNLFFVCMAAFAICCPLHAEVLDAEVHSLLKDYCYGCHGPEKSKADLNLSTFTDLESIHREPKLWENVLKQVSEREMPPSDKPQPTETEREHFVSYLSTALNNPNPASVPKYPGRKPLHRLSHIEYQNTIRDLFGVEFDAVTKFPSDGGGGGGFDNNASTLFVPPLLLEKYLEAADEILAKVQDARIFRFDSRKPAGKRIAAERIFGHFSERALRRPIQDGEILPLMKIYDRSVGSGEPHANAVKQALKALLISPQFIFRIEMDPAGSEPAQINEYELANRLSFFIWSSMPDDELFRLAERKVLSRPKVLEKQLGRMLKDKKAHAFSESFVSQWLHVRDLHTSAKPDPKRFPEYSDKLRDAIHAEPIEFFHHLLMRDGSLLDLLDADYTFLNEDVAKLYGLTGVKGDQFRRVSLSDTNRGGLIGMPGVLTLTSYPLRTSPVLRGKWILEEILGTPPPPPPPAVKSLPPDDRSKDGLTFRQRLERHREDPNCTSCHQKMDPLGFALENFDPLGRWRTEIAGMPVDASGEMATGEKISGPAELKQALLQKKEQFIRNVTERMLAYALGRGLEYYDITSVKKITDVVIEDDYSARTLLLEIVKSYPFQYRGGNEPQLSRK